MATDLRDTGAVRPVSRCAVPIRVPKAGRAEKLFSVFSGVATFHMAHLLFPSLL